MTTDERGVGRLAVGMPSQQLFTAPTLPRVAALPCQQNCRRPPSLPLGPVYPTPSPPATPNANAQLKRTPLYDFNVSRGGKMVPFAGYSMPLSYGDVGQVTAHKHVRSAAGLFDVSHMLQHIFSGPGATAFLESLTPTALSSIPEHGSSLTVLLNEEGGIIDDSIMTRHPNGEWYVVTNAGRVKEDVAHITQKLEAWNKANPDKQVQWKTLDGYGLVALQGPKAAEELQKITDYDLSTLKFGQSTYANVGKGKVRCHIARGGYTGEDGFEVSLSKRGGRRPASERS